MWSSKAKNYFAKSLTIAIACFLLLAFSPLKANAQTEQRSYLTLEKLQDKIQNPIQQEGRDTVDLSNYIIDLVNTDGDYNRQFYLLIDDTVIRSANPLSFDFSNSIIQGDFQLNRLGINSTIAKGALSSVFSPLEQEKINQYYPVNNTEQQLPRINILRGSLKFNNTIFTGKVDGSDSLFLQQLTVNSANFQNTVQFNRIFFAKEVDFSKSIFEQKNDSSSN